MRRPSHGSSISDSGGRRMFATRHKTTLARLFKKDEPANMHFSDEVVLMEGALTKLSHSKYFPTKPTYFILRSDTWSLCQYKSATDLTLLSETLLSKDDIVRDISDCAESRCPYVMELLRPHYNHPLRLATREARALEQWLGALETAIFEVGRTPSSSLQSAGRDVATHALPTEERTPVVIRSATLPPPASSLQAPLPHGDVTLDALEADLLDDRLSSGNNDNNNDPRCSDHKVRSSSAAKDHELESYDDSSDANETNQSDNDDDNNNNGDNDTDGYTPEMQSPEAVEDVRTITSPPAPAVLHDRVFKPKGNVARVAPGLTRNGYLSRGNVHSFSASGQLFTLDLKYSLLKPIGTGAYGAVIAAKNHEDGSSVAIKKIASIFDDLVDAKRILRETRLLGHFAHKNITKLLDVPAPPSREAFEDMYIIAELMETDLHQVIYSMQPMSDDHIKYFLYQILCALHHIHSAGVIHRDMKPSNILLNSNCDLKICDFGLARGGFPENAELTEYVVTRWYRAPEIMLNCLNYTESVDMWAVGCILAEMMQREPLFPGNDYIHQLKLIIKFMGTPKQEEIEFVKNAKALRFLTKLPIYKATKLDEAFPSANPEAVDLLKQMLVFNPEKRISVLDALQHPYLQAFYDPADIHASPPFDFEFDIPDEKLTKDALVDLLLEDVAVFHPEVTHWARPSPPVAEA
ncbi:CMGC/MAPK protein kinase [Saprolegnia diclina VS20]|uniref:Mitogen-activated protein kinase n=1 Tax=Saprolegnia diclina (strain VS20) TaxID=1156394 RepID=T0S290_SAPDV|nr:CMGC/MAPK protein kinase [Saprolegnia diclina VS20]EQC39018.1 CMGC/MAPK protein kinase [Saprolegnia diclina VS20]|eukprot:XP_008607842.1 CMGC/MAPK protein kinase [Saprolegnia diclina VS20]